MRQPNALSNAYRAAAAQLLAMADKDAVDPRITDSNDVDAVRQVELLTVETGKVLNPLFRALAVAGGLDAAEVEQWSEVVTDGLDGNLQDALWSRSCALADAEQDRRAFERRRLSTASQGVGLCGPFAKVA